MPWLGLPPCCAVPVFQTTCVGYCTGGACILPPGAYSFSGGGQALCKQTLPVNMLEAGWGALLPHRRCTAPRHKSHSHTLCSAASCNTLLGPVVSLGCDTHTPAG
jgi:hypothetical protein